MPAFFPRLWHVPLYNLTLCVHLCLLWINDSPMSSLFLMSRAMFLSAVATAQTTRSLSILSNSTRIGRPFSLRTAARIYTDHWARQREGRGRRVTLQVFMHFSFFLISGVFWLILLTNVPYSNSFFTDDWCYCIPLEYHGTFGKFTQPNVLSQPNTTALWNR